MSESVCDWSETNSGGYKYGRQRLTALVQHNKVSDTFGIVVRLRTRFDDPTEAMAVADEMLDALADAGLADVVPDDQQ